MKKMLCLLLCLALAVPCAFAEELPRAIQKEDADYAWLRETGLTIADRFQSGLECTWHSFLLSAANVPEDEMVAALSPLRMQDYTQPWSITLVRADQLLPQDIVEAWQEAIRAEEAARAARAALRSAEMVNTLAQVKVVKAEEKALKLTEEASKKTEDTVKAAEEVVRLAVEAEDEEAILAAQAIADMTDEAAKAAVEAVQAVKDLDKAEAVLAVKEAAKLVEEISKALEEDDEAEEEADDDFEFEFEFETEEEEKPEAEPEEKTEAELAAEEVTRTVEEAVKAWEEAVKAAENAVKAEENAVNAAQTLEDVRAGRIPTDEADEDSDGFSDDFSDTEDAWDEPEEAEESGLDDDDDWDDWDLDWDYSASAIPEEQRAWYIEEDPERDLYHSAPVILNAQEDEMFCAISQALQVTGIAMREEALDGPCYLVMYYSGLYALLVTYYPAGEGFISFSAQVIYSRSADKLLQP